MFSSPRSTRLVVVGGIAGLALAMLVTTPRKEIVPTVQEPAPPDMHGRVAEMGTILDDEE